MVATATNHRGTRTHDCCQVRARQPGIANPDRCDFSGQRPPDGASPARGTEFLGRKKAEAPVGGSQPGPRVRAFAESCLDALSDSEELTHQNVRFTRIGPRARGDAGAIRQNRPLRQRGGPEGRGLFAVVRMHKGAHSRPALRVVKRSFVNSHHRSRQVSCTPNPSLSSAVK